MRVIWTPRASVGLRSARAYIAEASPSAATRVADVIVRRTGELAVFPTKDGLAAGRTTRELVIPRTPFIVVYRIRPDHIDVLAVLHGARRWPEHL